MFCTKLATIPFEFRRWVFSARQHAERAIGLCYRKSVRPSVCQSYFRNQNEKRKLELLHFVLWVQKRELWQFAKRICLPGALFPIYELQTTENLNKLTFSLALVVLYDSKFYCYRMSLPWLIALCNCCIVSQYNIDLSDRIIRQIYIILRLYEWS